ncbi:Alpha/Beta hydrolase protein, partial [Mycena sanguinolenta]
MAASIRRLLAYCLPFLALCFFLQKGPPYASYRFSGENDHRKRLFMGIRALLPYSCLSKHQWPQISPTDELIWTDCSAMRTTESTTRFSSRPDDASAAIALIRTPSAVPHDSSSYRGPVLINPGGPGGSGVDMVAAAGALLSRIIGPEFDIVGFDPRGVSRSIPRISASIASVNSSADALARGWARGILLGQRAGKQDDGSLRFMTTDHTARDMLRIVQAHGREKLQYWGFSYGSVLGATFAAMFPQHVGRLVIDGVMDAEDYYATKWSKNLFDADKAWMSFIDIDGCVAAGPSACALYASTSAEIIAKVDKIYASLRTCPIPVRTNNASGLIDWTFVRGVIFGSLLSPYAFFSTEARILEDLYQGDGTSLFEITQHPASQCACDPSEYQFERLPEALYGVLCNDGERISPDYDDVAGHYERLSETSSWADMWALLRMPCLCVPSRPFVANTSFPLLLVGNTMDPVTPLWAAKKMSEGFAGSVVLTQDSPGHCSIASVSLCTFKYIREYFLDGTLPESGTVCAVDIPLFPPSPAPGTAFADADEDQAQARFVNALSVADRNLFEAAKELVGIVSYPVPKGHLNI